MRLGRVQTGLVWGIVLAVLLVAPGTGASAQPPALAPVTAHIENAALGGVGLVHAAKPAGYLTAGVRVLSSGKVRIKILTNAPKAKVKYRTAGNKSRTKVVRVPTRTHRATVTLPKGSTKITVRTLASKRLAPSPVLPVTPAQPVGSEPSGRPMFGCAAEVGGADDGDISLLLDACITGKYTDDPILGMRIYAYTDPGFTQLAPATANPIQLAEAQRTVAFEGLANNTTYYFRTTAFDRIGEGEQLHVGGLEAGVYLYRHHRPPLVGDVTFGPPGSVDLRWANDLTDPEPITSVIIGFAAGLTACDALDCFSARRVTQTPSSGPDWATRYVGGDFSPGTWCFRVWPVDAYGIGFASEPKCLIIS